MKRRVYIIFYFSTFCRRKRCRQRHKAQRMKREGDRTMDQELSRREFDILDILLASEQALSQRQLQERSGFHPRI